jgi:hypothetical protein
LGHTDHGGRNRPAAIAPAFCISLPADIIMTFVRPDDYRGSGAGRFIRDGAGDLWPVKADSVFALRKS